MENELPKGWISISPSEISKKIRGVSYGKNDVSNKPGKGLIPVLRANSIEDNNLVFKDLVYVHEGKINSNQLLQDGDVIIAMSSGSKHLVGKTAQFFDDRTASFGAFCGVLRPSPELNAKYFGYYFQSKEYRNTISEVAAGTNINNLKNEHFESLRIPIPPILEQHRIVAKLDAIMETVKRSRTRIEKIPIILKRLRQSILAAAADGKLTAEWRLQNFENEELVNGDGFPNKWVEKQLGEISTLVTSGSRGWAKYYSDEGSVFIRAQNINTDVLDLKDIAYVKIPDKSEGLRTKIQKGDLLITITGANVTKSALVESDIQDAYVSQHVGLVRLKDKSISKFIYYSIISLAHGRKQLLDSAYGQGKPQLNLDNIKSVIVAVPSKEEAFEIVRKVEQLLALANKLEDRYGNAKSYFDKVPQGILAKAFRGELVPQNENDEPASALLERIKRKMIKNPSGNKKGKVYKVK